MYVYIQSKLNNTERQTETRQIVILSRISKDVSLMVTNPPLLQIMESHHRKYFNTVSKIQNWSCHQEF